MSDVQRLAADTVGMAHAAVAALGTAQSNPEPSPPAFCAADADGLADWLRLEQTPGVGPETARKLLVAFGMPDNIFAASYSALCKVVPERIALALMAPIPEATAALVEKTLAWVVLPGNHVLTLADSAYPRALLDIPSPPMLLYVKGRVELLSAMSLAVVGSRNATAQGIANAESFSEALSQAGLTIISGLALGIDASAHKGGLKGPGSTVAVIGTGADIVYPARNRGLAHQVAELGCIVTEQPLGMPAISTNFPRRNRIISGLARGVLVVEAAANSGSLVTAAMAVEQNRDVFAIPGSIHSTLAKGCHQLIKRGAKLVETAQDVLEELHYHHSGAAASGVGAGPQPAPGAGPPMQAPSDPQAAALLEAMGYDAVGADSLSERVGLDAASLSAQLLTLELDGLVERLPGGGYRRLGA